MNNIAWQNLKDNQLVKTATIYLFASWMALQVIDVVFPIFHLTTYHQQWFFLLLVIIFPITMLFGWLRTAEHTDKQYKKRSLLVWVSAILVAFLGFTSGAQLLGRPMTKIVTIENEAGKKEYRELYREEFVKTVYLNPYENKTENEALDWIGAWMARGLYIDFKELSYIFSDYTLDHHNLHESQQRAQRSGSKFFVKGTYAIQSDSLIIDNFIYQSSNLKIEGTKKSVIHISSLTDYLDDLSLWVRQTVGLTNGIIDSETDLPIREMTTKIDSAAKYYALSQYSKAIQFDSTFSLAACDLAYHFYFLQVGTKAPRELIALAMKSRSRLGKNHNTELLIRYYLINDQRDAALKLIDQQLLMNPRDIGLLSEKRRLLSTWNRSEAVGTLIQLRELRDISYEEYVMTLLCLFSDNDLVAMDRLFEYMKNDFQGNPRLFLHEGYVAMANQDYKRAMSAFDNYLLNFPEDNWIKYCIESSKYYIKTDPQHISELQNKYRGVFLLDMGKMRAEFTKSGSAMYRQAENQNGQPYHFIDDSTLIVYTGDVFYSKKFILDKSESSYMFIHRQTAARNINNINEIRPYYFYKVTTTMDSAMQALDSQEYIIARRLFQKSIEKYPNHYFLKDYLRHIEFMTEEQFAGHRLLINEWVGTYKDLRNDRDRIISLEDGKMYYKRLHTPTSSGSLILPLSESFFKTDINEFFIAEIVREGGEIIGFQSWIFNHETLKYERSEDLFPKDSGINILN